MFLKPEFLPYPLCHRIGASELGSGWVTRSPSHHSSSRSRFNRRQVCSPRWNSGAVTAWSSKVFLRQEIGPDKNRVEKMRARAFRVYPSLMRASLTSAVDRLSSCNTRCISETARCSWLARGVEGTSRRGVLLLTFQPARDLTGSFWRPAIWQ